MCSVLVILATLFLIAAVHATPLGVIPNVSLILMTSNLTMNGSTCHDCKCVMFTPTNNGTILSFNCFTIESSRVNCQFFTAKAYQATYSHQMVTNSNSTFFFQQLPTESPLQTTTELTTTSSSMVAMSGTLGIPSVLEFFIPLIRQTLSYHTRSHGDGNTIDHNYNTTRRCRDRLV